VIVWDVIERRVRSKTKSHTDLITSLGWRDDGLWTASDDGTLKHWRNDIGEMTLIDTSREQGSFRSLRTFADGWTASVNHQELLIHRTTPVGTLRLDLGSSIERIEVSSDSRYLAATSSSEVIIIDQVGLAIAALPVSTSSLGYVGFINPDTLIISKADGLFTVSLSALGFVRFETRH
jgi:WD40 repeat protein